MVSLNCIVNSSTKTIGTECVDDECYCLAFSNLDANTIFMCDIGTA